MFVASDTLTLRYAGTADPAGLLAWQRRPVGWRLYCEAKKIMHRYNGTCSAIQAPVTNVGSYVGQVGRTVTLPLQGTCTP